MGCIIEQFPAFRFNRFQPVPKRVNQPLGYNLVLAAVTGQPEG
jgi:hypothetical protein